MHRDQTEYELFVTYARRDNRPHPWVRVIHDQLLLAQRRKARAQQIPATVSVDALSEDDAFRLLCEHPPKKYFASLANAGIFPMEKVLPYRPLPVAVKLPAATHTVIERLASSDRNNAEWRRALDILAGRVQAGLHVSP